MNRIYLDHNATTPVARQVIDAIGRNLAENWGNPSSVHWAGQAAESSYPVDVCVVAADRKGLLRDISSVFADDDVDVTGVNTRSDRRTDTATMHFTVEIRDTAQLDRVLLKVNQVPDVVQVKRSH